MQAFNHSIKYNCNLFVSNFIDHDFMQSNKIFYLELDYDISNNNN